MRRILFVVTLVASAGCSLLTDLDGLSNGAAATDASTDTSVAESGVVDSSPSTDAPADDAGASDAGVDGDSAGIDAGPLYRDLVTTTPGLRTYWHFDELAGTTVSPSFGSVVGTIYSASPGNAGIVPNEAAGKSITFNNNGTVQFGDHFDFAGKAPFSVELWHQPTAVSSYVNLWRKQNNAAGGWVVSYDGTKGYQFYRLDATTGEQVVSNIVPAPGSIHHVVATYDGTGHRLYVDGVPRGGVVSNNVLSLPDTIDGCTLGYEALGRVDEAALYDGALSAATIADHYRVGMIPR